MKTKSISIILRTIFLLLISSGVYSQDALFSNVAVSPSSTVSPLDQFTVSYTMTNNDISIAMGDGINLDIAFDDINFGYNSFSSSDTSWMGCTPGMVSIIGVNGGAPTQGVSCSYQGNLLPSASSSIDVIFDTGSIAANGMYNFEANLVDVGALDINLGNNRDTQIITVGVGVPPDLDFVDAATPANYPATEGDTAPVVLDFQVTNLGGDTTTGASFSLPYNDSFFTYNATASNPIPPGWNCIGGTSSVDCFTNISIEVLAATITTFKVAFNTSGFVGNATASGGPYTFTPTIFTSGDANSANNSISTDIVVSVLPTTDLEVLKLAKDSVGGMVILGADLNNPFVYSIQVNNLSVTAANNIEITDNVPAGIEITGTSQSNPNWNCNTTAFVNVFTSQTVTCTRSTIAASEFNFGELIVLDAIGRSASSGIPYTNTANVTAVDETDFNSSNDIGTADIFINSLPPDIQFEGSITPTYIPIAEGDLSSQTVLYQILNNGADSFDGAEVALTFDMTKFSLVASTVNPGWSCSPGQPGTYFCSTFANFPSAAIADFDVQLTPLPAAVAGFYASVIIADVYPVLGGLALKDKPEKPVIKALIGTQILTDVEIIQPVNPDIVINKTFGNGFFTNTITQATAGSFVTYKILADAIDMGGSGPGSTVQITDSLPAGVSFDSMNILGPNFNCTESVGVITCNASTLPITTAEDGVEITLLVTGVVGDIITNTATISAVNDSNGGNNSSSPGSFTVVSTIPTTITVDKQVIQNGVPVQSISSGDSFIYRLAIQNTGGFDALNIQAIDNMPSGVLVNSIAGIGWTCNNVGQQYTCDYPGPLAPNATTFLNFNVVDVTDNTVTQLLNFVNVTAFNAPTVSDSIFTSITDVSIDIQVTQNPNPIEEGQIFDVIIDISNTGSEDITGIQVVNTIPDGFSYAPTAKTSTCIINGQDMTCTVDMPIVSGTIESIVVGVQALPMVDSNATYINTTIISGNSIPTPIIIETVTNVSATGTGSGGFNFDVTLSTDMNSVETGIPYNYIINVENTGSNNITFMDIDLTLPSELTVLSMMNNGFTCTGSSFGLSCSADQGFDLAPGANIDVIQIEVQSDVFIGDVLVDLTSRIGSVLVRTTNATTIITSPSTLTPDLSVAVISGDSIDQGEVSEFEVKVSNLGPDDAQDVTLNVNVAGILDTVSVDPGSDWTCQTNNLTVDCQFKLSLLPNGHSSSVFITANTTRVVIDAEDVVVMATVETTSDDTDLSNNTASSSVGVSGTPTEGDIGGALRDALGSSGDPQTDRAIDAVAGYCELEYFTALEALCDDLYNAALAGDRDAVARFLKEITPNEVIGQSTSLNEISLAQFRNVGARLNQLRSGGGSGFSSAGLNARYGNGSIPLGMLAYLNQTEEEANSSKIDTNNDFITPWGFFVNGTISMGERDATGRELGFDFDTYGLTAGFDYRIDAKKVVGIAIGYANFDSKIEGSAELNSTGITLTGYGSFYVNDNFYVDARISLAKPDFEQSRKIDFTLGSTHIDRIAVGDTTANQYSVSMSAGYSFYKNAWNITPNASFTYTSTNIDSFTESGAGDFNIVYSEQDLESLVWSAGIRVSKAVSLKSGVITPQFDFDYNYQGLNDDSLIEARFINAPSSQMFILETDTPDRSYGSAGVGLVYISANGKQAYINYRSVLGLEGFSRGTYNIGARFEF